MSDSPVGAVEADLNAIALEFLDSPYAGDRFTGWPIDGRLVAYLRRRGLTAIADDGTVFHSLLDKVMTSIALARRTKSSETPAGRFHRN